MTSKQELTTKIEYLRKQMIEIGLKTGLTSPDTVQISQELDRLLMTLNKNNNSSV